MSQSTETNKEKIVEQLTRPVIKLILALVGLAIVRAIIGRLPGLNEASVPGFNYISLTTVGRSVVILVMVAIVVNFALEIEPRLRNILSGPPDLVADAASIVKNILFISVLIIAYGGLENLGRPIIFMELGQSEVIYDYLFLLVALAPAGIVSLKMYNNLDDITDLLTGKVKSAAVETVFCPECGREVRVSQDFCPDCGESIDAKSTTQQDDSPNSCPECGGFVEDDAGFCGSCGADIK